MIISTVAAMAAGYVLGVIFGTPKPLSARRYLFSLIHWLSPRISAKYQSTEGGQHTAGTVTLTLLILILLVPTLLILILLYCFFPAGAIVVDALLCWSALDIKGINRRASAVSRAVRAGNAPKAAMLAEKLSSADCDGFELDESVRAGVQGIADRTVDHIVAPLFYSFILSGAGSLLWCLVDEAAMYRNDYDEFSDAFNAPFAKLRDILAFIPGKLAAIFMLVNALFLKLDTISAEYTLSRDSKKMRKSLLWRLSCRACGRTRYFTSTRRALQRTAYTHLYHRRT